MSKPGLISGSLLDGFIIGEKLHQGGMAQLWQVTKQDTQEAFLMKIPLLREGEDPAAIVSFEMEQMIMPRLKGPHVPRHIANGDFATTPYIVMERIAGKSLLSRLENLPLPIPELCALGARIADALHSLHQQGVIHLDIKPSNIMFRPSGEAVLVDFGLSRCRDLPDLLKEEFRLPYGTAPYMAPEQVMGIRTDPRSDIFALGCLLYFFATGTRPFGDPQKLKGLKQRLWRDPLPPRRLNAEIPQWFQEILLRCLEVRAGRRYPTPAQLAHDLRHPEQINLTPRASKQDRDGFFAVLKRKSEAPMALLDPPPAFFTMDSPQAPIIAVAVDLDDATPGLAQSLRHTAQAILATHPQARLAALNVLRLNRIAMDQSLDAQGHNKHIQRLVGLKDWARSLDIAQAHITYHVLEAVDPAEAILEFARINHVEHIIMGARANSTMRKILGSVSGKVAAEAPCSVTVSRVLAE